MHAEDLTEPAPRSSRPPRRIVIAGGGTAGWMCAAALARFVASPHTAIYLVESESIGTIGVGEATLPGLLDFHTLLGLSEPDLLQATQGTVKLGIEFSGWGGRGNRYVHPFGDIGLDLEGFPFHQIWLGAMGQGPAAPFEDFSMAWRAARKGALPAHPPAPDSPAGQIRHAYHLDAHLYAVLLRRYAESKGVSRLDGRIERVETEGEAITALTLETGFRLEGDFFFDCTGFASLLLGQTLNSGFQDWSRWLPCNRAIARPESLDEPPRLYTRARAHTAGWSWDIPLQHRKGRGIVYADGVMDDEMALACLDSETDGTPLADPNLIHFTPGRRDTFWKSNCIGLGLSAGFLEPLESTAIQLIQDGILKALELLPTDADSEIRSNAYNRYMAERYDQVRDFLLLHYVLNPRDDSPFWREIKTCSLPDSLKQRLELWRSGGHLLPDRNHLFSSSSWVSVLIGQGIMPRHTDPLLARMAQTWPHQVLAELTRIYDREEGQFTARPAIMATRE